MSAIISDHSYKIKTSELSDSPSGSHDLSMCLHDTPGPNHEITLGIPNMTSIYLVNLFNNKYK